MMLVGQDLCRRIFRKLFDLLKEHFDIGRLLFENQL